MTQSGEVLVLDGDASIRRLVEVVIRTIDLKAVVAVDKQRAMELLDSGSYEAVVVEMVQPGIGRESLLDEVGRRRPDLLGRTIVLTTAPESTWKTCPHTKGVAAVLRKPFAISDLQNALRKCSNS